MVIKITQPSLHRTQVGGVAPDGSLSGLGINHEQKRYDGSGEYYGKGPHLQMFWENTESWASQYTPDWKTYVGSPDDGDNDPQVGYAPYDFVSLLNCWISRNWWFVTLKMNICLPLATNFTIGFFVHHSPFLEVSWRVYGVASSQARSS